MLHSPRWNWRIALLQGVVAIALTFGTTHASAQSDDGFPIDLVETWIRGKVSAERAWNRGLSQAGLGFELDASTEARLRHAGADDDWIAVLRRARFNPPARAATHMGPTIGRRQLRPLYFGTEARVSFYTGLLRLTETGGAVTGKALDTSSGRLPLRSAPLDKSAMAYGLTIDYSSIGLDLEGAFEDDLLLLNLGLKYSPFIPVGASGFRALLGVKPFVGIARQTLARLPRGTFGTDEPVVELLNTIYGGEASTGLAYHWRPGKWIFVEVAYRATSTLSRELRSPDGTSITDGIPWSKWSARGSVFRLGVGF